MSTKFSIDPAYDPATFGLKMGAGQATADRKAPPPSEIYPNINDFARVDRERYYTQEHMKLEWDRLWTKTWTCAGRANDITIPGSYFRYDLGHESFIISRGHDNEIRAFYNVCQHRGRQLVDNDFGRRPGFVCRFHSWAYDLTGKNTRVTDRETFSPRALCGSLDLKQVRCETWAGFVFINMDPAAPPLLEYLGEIPELMAAYTMENMHVVKDTLLEIDCNWKIGVEPFIESYHLHVTHPQALPMVDDVYEQFDAYKNGHGRLATPLAVPSPRTGKPDEINDGIRFMMAEAGLDPASYTGSAAGIPKAMAAAKRAADNRYGLDYSAFTDSQILDDWNYFIYPNMTFNTHPEGVLIMRFLPHPTNPEKFFYHVLVIMPKLKEGTKAPFYFGVDDDVDISGATRPAREHTTMERPHMGEVLEQDISNMVATQRGLRSRGLSDGMRFAEREGRCQVFHAETDLYLKGLK
jgi:phenylpropionate dioxygenase-like ring-hydroxylating dioxygenase large terminal subunit